MNCERCSELLIEYMDGGLGPEEMAAVAGHLIVCEECAREFEEYAEIRRVVTEESPLPAPSEDVMARLSKAARDSVAREKRPFWKRWPYSPVLIPVLSSAIAIMVWFYYGHGGVDVMDTASRDVLASKMKEPVEMTGQARPEMRREYPAVAESSPALGEGGASDEVKAAAPAAPPEEETSSLMDQSPVEQMGSARAKKALPGSETEKSEQAKTLSQAASSDAGKDYTGLLRLALRQQTEGDCDASIRTNEILLQASPEPPGDVQAQSYRSLAECYEKQGKLDLAVMNYTQLGRVSPGDSGFVNSRIMRIRDRSMQKLSVVTPEPTPTPVN
jgi:anti-sigma factor RsiW